MTDDELDTQQPTKQLTSRRTTSSRPPRMAKKVAGATEAKQQRPNGRSEKPTLDLTPDEPYDELVEVEPIRPNAPPPTTDPVPDLEPAAAEAIADTVAEDGAQRGQQSEPVPARTDDGSSEAELPATVRETLQVIDESWRAFHARAARFPAERMDERLSEDGWTRKQMLAHVAAWHDLTAERLLTYFTTGRPPEFDQDIDQFNANIARRAIGKTAGEVLNDTEATFNRLRRQVQRLSDAQLLDFERWAAWVIRANTYGHYEEHWQDVHSAHAAASSARR